MNIIPDPLQVMLNMLPFLVTIVGLYLISEIVTAGGEPVEFVGVLVGTDALAIGNVEIEKPHRADGGAQHPALWILQTW